MALSLNHVFGRRALALVGVGAATALTSWFIFLRNRYLKQITQGKDSDGKSKHNRRQGRDASPNGGPFAEASDSGHPDEAEEADDEAELASNNYDSAGDAADQAKADLQMESLAAGTAIKLDGGGGGQRQQLRTRRHVTPIAEEAEATVIDDSTIDRVVSARPGYRPATAAATGAAAAAAAPETEIVDSDFEQEIRAASAAAAAATAPATSDAPAEIGGEFMANRLAAMSKSDCANVQLLDRDSAVLAVCLRASGGSCQGQAVDATRALQLVGRLAQFQHHLDRLSLGGELVLAVCDTFGSPGATVDVRLQCLLNLVNLSGVPSNQQAIVDIADAVAEATSTPRLAQYALQLLANLALYDRCRHRLLPQLPRFLALLRRLLTEPAAEDPRCLKQCLTLLGNLTSDQGTRRAALAGPVEPDALAVPTGVQLTGADSAIRLAWVCFTANLTCESDQLLLLANQHSVPPTLAAVFMANLPALSKLAQKQRDKLRSSEKATEYGQRLTSLSKDLKALLRQAKVKSK